MRKAIDVAIAVDLRSWRRPAQQDAMILFSGDTDILKLGN